jgi:aryl-alcohol dehydrogenase-like predicted oxidoreductase
MQRDPERNGVLATCEELGIGFVPWGPIGQGYLTGKIDARTKFDPKMDMRSGFPRFSPKNIEANMPIVEFLKQFAKKKNSTPAQLSLAWLLSQKPWIVPNSRHTQHGSLARESRSNRCSVTPEDLREIEIALSGITVHGAE